MSERLPIPRWEEMSAGRRALEAVALPVAWGIVCGVLLSVAEIPYLAASALAILGGIGGGAQHAVLRAAMVRALAGGTIFGLSILLGFELTGADDPKATLPDPSILLLLGTVVPAFPLHWIGWRLRRRSAAA